MVDARQHHRRIQQPRDEENSPAVRQIEIRAKGGAETSDTTAAAGEDANERLRDPERLQISGKVDQEEERHLLEQGGREDLAAEIGAEAGGHSRWKVTAPAVRGGCIRKTRCSPTPISIVIGGALGVP